jgi:poly(3-hydroxybutyrate) depolymerase
MGRILAFLAALVPWCADAANAPQLEKFAFGQAPRSQEIFVPHSASTPAPLLVLLHGSFGKGRDMVREWMDIAQREGIVVVAPNASDDEHWRLVQDGPAFIQAAIDAVAAKHPIDRRRIYLFGHSGGAVYALTLSMLESERFAATAIFAGAWRNRKEYAPLQLAKRKIPVAIYLGDQDELFPVRSAEQTITALQAAGHPVSLTILPRRRHAYRDAAPAVNELAWRFLSSHALPEPPHANGALLLSSEEERS